MKRLLLISYFFGHRTMRLMGLAKHLPRFGWEVEVITTDPPDGANNGNLLLYPPSDLIDSARSSLPFNARYAPRCLKAAWEEIVCYPDPMKNWLVGESLSYNTPDAVMSSGPPHSAHRIALREAKKLGVPWVVDLPDLWTQNAYYQYHQPRKSIERLLERKVFGQADALVTVSEPLKHDLERLHNVKVHSIPNGFEPLSNLPTDVRNDRLTLIYAGQLYNGRRDPTIVNEAIKGLPIDFQLITFDGDKRLPRSEVLQREMHSDVLVLLLWNDKRDVGTYTGKLFEYLSLKRPILAVGHKGCVVQSLLEETGAGVFVSNPQECKCAIREWFEEWKASGQVSYRGNEQAVNAYTHEAMARRYARLLDDLVGKTGEAR